MTENKVSLDEEKRKRVSVDGYTGLKQCGPDDLDNRVDPEIDPSVAASYPTRDQARVPYNREDDNFKVRVVYQDGYHPDDRWNLTDAQIGSGTPHSHEDWKRSPPEILDQDPKASRRGYQANFRLPDSRAIYEVPGDRLGPTEEQRAKKPKSQLTDNSVPCQTNERG